MQAVVARIKATRTAFLPRLAALPYLHPYPSEANFILCDVVGRDARALKQTLEQRGILVRHYDKPGLRNCIRISMGTDTQMETLLETLRALAA
jgi:histidinol-phosphate aminotransferase